MAGGRDIATVVCGRSGRMARLLARAVDEADGLTLAGRLDLRDECAADSGSGGPGGLGQPADVVDGARVVRAVRDVPAVEPVVVDFTAREATARLLADAADTPCSLVVGTSGLTREDHDALRALGHDHAVLQAANFSLALATIRDFIADLADTADDLWDAGVVDIHFAGKRDKPSATAVTLAGTWHERRGTHTAPEIAAFRMSDAVSEHRFLAGGTGEQIEVSHRVTDRAAFVPGVLTAIRFVRHAPPGLYSLEDALCG